MKTNTYLVVILLIIMAFGARTMFEVAYQGMAFEHDTMNHRVAFLLGVVAWYILMMVADIILLRGKNIKGRNALIACLTAGVMVPTIYMLISK